MCFHRTFSRCVREGSSTVYSYICGERCVLSASFPNCLDKLISLPIYFFFIPVWKTWVWRFKETPLEVASVSVVRNTVYIFMKVGNNPSTALFFLIWWDVFFSGLSFRGNHALFSLPLQLLKIGLLTGVSSSLCQLLFWHKLSYQLHTEITLK